MLNPKLAALCFFIFGVGGVAPPASFGPAWFLVLCRSAVKNIQNCWAGLWRHLRLCQMDKASFLTTRCCHSLAMSCGSLSVSPLAKWWLLSPGQPPVRPKGLLFAGPPFVSRQQAMVTRARSSARSVFFLHWLMQESCLSGRGSELRVKLILSQCFDGLRSSHPSRTATFFRDSVGCCLLNCENI